MAPMDTAGLHDPYWYEGSVGLLSAIDMLNPDSEIESVTFQKTGTKGLDDYEPGSGRKRRLKPVKDRE